MPGAPSAPTHPFLQTTGCTGTHFPCPPHARGPIFLPDMLQHATITQALHTPPATCHGALCQGTHQFSHGSPSPRGTAPVDLGSAPGPAASLLSWEQRRPRGLPCQEHSGHRRTPHSSPRCRSSRARPLQPGERHFKALSHESAGLSSSAVLTPPHPAVWSVTGLLLQLSTK